MGVHKVWYWMKSISFQALIYLYKDKENSFCGPLTLQSLLGSWTIWLKAVEISCVPLFTVPLFLCLNFDITNRHVFPLKYANILNL